MLRGSHSKVQDLAPWSVVEEALEPTGCERGVARGLLDIGVPHVGLDRPGVVAIVGELKPRGMPQHVGVDLDAEIGFDAGALDQRLNPGAESGAPRSDTNTKGDCTLSR